MILGLGADIEGGVPAPVPSGAPKISEGTAALGELGLNLVLPAIVVSIVDRQKHPVMWWLFGAVPVALAGAKYGIRVGMIKRP
jgi:hypothetical protein